MKKTHLDAILDSIRAETADVAVEAEAINRVRSRVFAAAADPAVDTLRTCADFQSLLRPYLAKSLPESRVMLLEDHVHSCVDCRRALSAARSGKVLTMTRPRVVQHELPAYFKNAAAVAAVLVVSLTGWGIVRMLPSAGTRATVQSVSGILYAVSDQSSAPIFSGRQIGDGQRVRTAKESTALLRLSDGSLVEMNERAELSITQNARGANIRLDRGNIIVQAARQKHGALFVSTPDCLVTVHGTVFAVTRGVKGTRVSVAEGEVKVDESGRSELLHPGDQTASSPSIAKTDIQNDFAWSRNSAKYLALVGEFAGIQKQLEQIPGPALRYESKLLDIVPGNTVIYAAIPNLGNTLAEASRLFNDRVQQSDVLREWWTQNQPKGEHNLDDIVNRLRTFSGYLGNEVVLAIFGDREEKYKPLLVAEVTKPGLREFLEGQARELGANGSLVYIDPANQARAAAPTKTAAPRLAMTIQNDVVAIGTEDAVSQFVNREHGAFAGTRFHDVIAKSYDSGVGYLFCANLEQFRRQSVFNERRDVENSPTGLQDVRYLIFERKEINGRTDNRIALNFRRVRQGFASWLGAPGAMGSLDFVSPNALVAAGFVLRNPQSLLGELFTYAKNQNSTFTEHLAEFEQKSGINLLNDLAGPLGTDAAFAIDGPVFPVPNWEFAMEVYSPDRLQWTIDKLVDTFNRDNPDHAISLAKEKVGDRMFYTLSSPNMNVEAHYTFADSYFLAGATRGILLRAIQNRQNGYTLSRSDKFRALLPQDSYPSFSGLIYHNIGPLIGPIADQLKSLNAITPAQRKSLEALEGNSGPGLIFAYGEPDRIVISGNGPLFGLGLDSLAVPNVIATAMHQAGGRGYRK